MRTGIFEGSNCGPCFEGSVLRDLSWFQQIKKDLKKYSKIFEQKDRLSQSKASKVSLRGCSRVRIPVWAWAIVRRVCQEPDLVCSPMCEVVVSNGQQGQHWSMEPIPTNTG